MFTSKLNAMDFDDFCDFMAVVGKESAQRSKSRFTLKRWAKILGYRSPRSIAMVLKKQRMPTIEMARRLASTLSLDQEQATHIEHLAVYSRLKMQGKDVRAIWDSIQGSKSTGAVSKMGKEKLYIDRFAVIADWHNLVIRQLVGLKGFRNSASWVAKRLGHKITPAEVKTSLKRLVELGLIFKDADIKKYWMNSHFFTTTDDISSEAIRLHHLGQIQRALEALDAQAVEQREISSLTFRFSSSRMSEAKAMIRKFQDEFHRHFEDEADADEVYQLNVQFFSHTYVEEGRK